MSQSESGLDSWVAPWRTVTWGRGPHHKEDFAWVRNKLLDFVLAAKLNPS